MKCTLTFRSVIDVLDETWHDYRQICELIFSGEENVSGQEFPFISYATLQPLIYYKSQSTHRKYKNTPLEDTYQCFSTSCMDQIQDQKIRPPPSHRILFWPNFGILQFGSPLSFTDRETGSYMFKIVAGEL